MEGFLFLRATSGQEGNARPGAKESGMQDSHSPEDNEFSHDLLRWTVWPARQRPHAAAACAALILGVSWYGYASLGHWAYSVIALVVLTSSLSSFLLPTTYEVSGQGVRQLGWLHRRSLGWAELRCFVRAPDFLALSVSDPPTTRSISRGMILRLSGNGHEVARAVAQHIPEWRAPKDSPEDEK